MSLQTKRGQSGGIPAWAMNDEKLANVVATYADGRAGIRTDGAPTAERIARSEARLCAQIPILAGRLNLAIEEYRTCNADGADKTALRRLETHALALDSELWMIRYGVT